MTTIQLDPSFLDAVASGRKTTTIRRGIRDYTLGEASLQCGDVTIPIFITSLRLCQVWQLQATDAVSDGFNSMDDLHATLKKFYPDLCDESEVTIVCFVVQE